jgi:hypothetical protein
MDLVQEQGNKKTPAKGRRFMSISGGLIWKEGSHLVKDRFCCSLWAYPIEEIHER